MPRIVTFSQEDAAPAGPPSRRAAYHEAGHAAMMAATVNCTGSGPDYVWATAEEGGCGQSIRPEVLAWMGGAPAPDMRPELLVLVAGRVAEECAGVAIDDRRDWLDVRTARGMAEAMAGEGAAADELLAQVRAEARAVLNHPCVWAAVERIAAELLRVGRVEGPDLARLLAGK